MTALRRPEVRWVVGLTLAALALRLAVAGIPSYWLDEAFTVLILERSLGDALSLIPDTESTPPLYYVLAWGWAKAFGTDELAVRSLSSVFGAATVPVGYLAGARLLDRRTGVIAAALLAFNPFLVWFAQEARAYALMVLLCAVSVHAFLWWLQERRDAALATWAVASVLALATHYYASLTVVAELGWMLLAAPAARRRVLLAAAPVAVAGLALLPLAVAQRDNPLAASVGEDDSTILRTLQVPKQFAVGFDAPQETLVAVVCLLLAGAGAALVAFARPRLERDRVAPAAVVGATVVLAPVLLAVTGLDYVSARYEVAGLVPLALCVAAGCAAPRARRLGPGIAVALCAIWLAVVVADARDPLLHTRADWRGAAEAVGPVPAGGRVICLTPASGRTPFRVYLPDAQLLTAASTVAREVVLLTVRSSAEERSASRALTRGTAPPFLPPGFREIGRRRTDTYVLVRYRAAGPLPVTLVGLGAGRLDPLPFVALAQR